MRIGELLLEAQLVTEEQIEHALVHSEGLRLGSALIASRAVEPDVVARALAQQLGVPPARSADLIAVDPATRAAVPDALQKRLFALPYKVHGTGNQRVLEVAMRDPENQAAINELKVVSGMRIDARVAPEVLLKEALYPRTELPPASAFEAPAAAGAGASPDDGGLELDLDRVKRPSDAPPSGNRRHLPYTRSTQPPASAGATGGPTSGATPTPLPPLQYDAEEPPGKAVGQIAKLLFALAAIALVVFVGMRFKKCITSTTKSVGAHYDSKILGVGIDFPPDNGWRVAPTFKVQIGASRSEYFYRGGVPEQPVVAIVLARGPADDVSSAAQRALVDLVTDAMVMGCMPSEDRAGAIVCKGGGTMTLFGRKTRNVTVDVHAWVITTGELMMAVVINSDQTMSETQYILTSVTEQ